MDNSVIANSAQESKIQFHRLLLGVNTSIPGVVVSFDPLTQLATVKPAVRMQVTVGPDVSFIDLPVIHSVPVCLPYSAGAFLAVTIPIQAGDECLLIFSQRAIDNFVEHGGIQNPIETGNQSTATGRSHDLTDAVCIPGIISGPHAIPNYNNAAVEIRNMAKTVYVSVSSTGISSKGTWLHEGDITATGTVKGSTDIQIGASSKSLLTHKHSGVQTGGGQTGTLV